MGIRYFCDCCGEPMTGIYYRARFSSVPINSPNPIEALAASLEVLSNREDPECMYCRACIARAKEALQPVEAEEGS